MHNIEYSLIVEGFPTMYRNLTKNVGTTKAKDPVSERKLFLSGNI